MKTIVNSLVIIIIVFPIAMIPSSTAQAATYTVTNTNDSGDGSLRWAIDQARTNPGADTISFNIPAHLCDLSTHICTIVPNSAFPAINDDSTTIDGYSQSGAAPATENTPAIIRIEIDGTNAGSVYGLEIRSAQNIIRGLAIYNYDFDGIFLNGAGAHHNQIEGNYLGLDASGNSAGNGFTGVYIRSGAHENTIGGNTSSQRNIISGNDQSGVEICDVNTDDNIIRGNYIGTTPDGMSALPNVTQGVIIKRGAKSNLLFHNFISANQYGVVISNIGDLDVTSDNMIENNGIGISKDLTPLGNTKDGIWISNLGQENGILANYIAYNGEDGVHIDMPTAFDNQIIYNIIHNNNGKGIHLSNDANNMIQPPVILQSHLDTFSISGAVCPNCYVQIFASRADDGEGETIVGEGIAGAAGDFGIDLFDLPGPYITATATDMDDGTSEFSDVFIWSLTYIPMAVK